MEYVILKADHGDLQKELAMLNVWMIKRQMEFSLYKCIMHEEKNDLTIYLQRLALNKL